MKYIHAVFILPAQKVYRFRFSAEFVSLAMWLSFQIRRVGLNCMVLSGAYIELVYSLQHIHILVYNEVCFLLFPIPLTYTNTKRDMI